MNTPTFEGKISVAIDAQMKSPTFEGKIPICHEGTDEYLSIRETKIWLLLKTNIKLITLEGSTLNGRYFGA